MSAFELGGEGGAGGGGNTTITSRATATQTVNTDVTQGNITFGKKAPFSSLKLEQSTIIYLAAGVLLVALASVLTKGRK